MRITHSLCACADVTVHVTLYNQLILVLLLLLLLFLLLLLGHY
jgi:hypothetical protein